MGESFLFQGDHFTEANTIDALTLPLHLLGGVGLFLLGMIIMTNGLKALAGNAMRRLLLRFTHTPLSGATTGAVATAILQSSSAITVAAVGFVGAGLMTYPSALGIIFGANIGTTLTGWLVALFGLKFKLGSVMLPVIFSGVVLHLFASGRWKQIGLALAGFGLIFVGIDTLQEAMRGNEHMVTPDVFPPDGLFGRLQLVGIGILITLVTQSSSAGVAAALTAVYAGAISFEQGAALVIGMDVGTTATAALATVGGSAGSRRTGLSHVIYNLLTAIGALVLLNPYTQAWQAIAPERFAADAEIALVGFHTTFNFLGVVFVLPLAGQFARLMTYLVPEQESVFTRGLDRALLGEPRVALTALEASLVLELKAMLQSIRHQLGRSAPPEVGLSELEASLNRTHAYADRIHLDPGKAPDWSRLVTMIHALDHMQRLLERCTETGRIHMARDTAQLQQVVTVLDACLVTILHSLEPGQWQQADAAAGEASAVLDNQTEALRETIMQQVARGELDVPGGTDQLEAIRWAQRTGTHIARITSHLAPMHTAPNGI